MPTIRLTAGLIWGYIADKYRCRKPITLFNIIFGVGVLCLLGVPYLSKTYSDIVIISCVSSLFTSEGILDAYCLDLLGEKHKEKYGRYRLWLTISYGGGSVIMGWVT